MVHKNVNKLIYKGTTKLEKKKILCKGKQNIFESNIFFRLKFLHSLTNIICLFIRY
jgi:hypothetical protein